MQLEKYFQYQVATITLAKEGDVSKLVEIINHAYSYQDAAKGGPRTNPAHLKARIDDTDFYVVKIKDQILGCVYLEQKTPALHFGLLTVIPELKGKGLAQAIMTSIEQYATAEHFATLELDYMSLAPWLKAYYERYGFRETGQETAWGSINLIRMSKKLP